MWGACVSCSPIRNIFPLPSTASLSAEYVTYISLLEVFGLILRLKIVMNLYVYVSGGRPMHE